MTALLEGLPRLLAHGGPGATWQALVTTLAVGLAILFLLVAFGVVDVSRPSDLVLPVAAVVVISSVAPSASDTLSDAIGWALPLGVVVLAGLLLAGATDLDAGPRGPLFYGVVVVAAVSALVLHDPLTRSLHPPAELTPLSDDAVVTIAAPEDGAELDDGGVTLEVRLEGGTVGPPGLEDAPGTDPEEAGQVALFVDAQRITAPPSETCTVDEPCTTLTWQLDLAPGEHTASVEFADFRGVPFSPVVTDTVRFTVTGADTAG